MSKQRTMYRQCTLYRRDNFGTVKKLVEWVPAPLAVIDGKVTCQGHVWDVIHVGARSADPRSAHESKTIRS